MGHERGILENQNTSQQVRRGKGSRVSVALILVGAFTYLATWAGLIGNLGNGYWIYAACIMWVASVLFALGLRIELRNHHWPKRRYNTAACVVIAAAILVGIPPIILQLTGPHIRPPAVEPNRVQLSDGTNLFGKRVIISNPNDCEIYALTLGLEIEHLAASISSVRTELAPPYSEEKSIDGGDPRVGFSYSLEHFEPGYRECRFIGFQMLKPNERRPLWIRGTTLTNSFADISVLQFMRKPPQIRYSTNGQWTWPILSGTSPYWKRSRSKPMDLGLGVQMEYSNHIKIPSRP
jgi:hypothetical protein